jgi:hypothetical protein
MKCEPLWTSCSEILVFLDREDVSAPTLTTRRSTMRKTFLAALLAAFLLPASGFAQNPIANLSITKPGVTPNYAVGAQGAGAGGVPMPILVNPSTSTNSGYAAPYVANVTTTHTSTSYPAGYCVGTYAAITVVGNNAESGWLTSLRISSIGGVLWPLQVYVFGTAPAGTYTDDAACLLSTANSDQDKLIAAPQAVTLASPGSTGGSTASFGEVTFSPPRAFVTGSGVKTIYVLLVTTGTTTSGSSTTDVHLSASVLQN